MRSSLIIFALLSAGCHLVEYVLPEGSTTEPGTTGASAADATGPTTTGAAGSTASSGTAGDTDPTSGDSGDVQTTGEVCDDGLDRCDDACVDLTEDDAHCGTCGEGCKADERCIASECRDILVVDCAACPCGACSAGDGLLETTGGGDDDGGGDKPQKYLCCPPADGAPKVVCVVGDPEDPLVCPGGDGG